MNSQHSYQIKRQRQYQGLKDKQVYLTDTTVLSEGYFKLSDLPVELTAGKNIIKLLGNNNTLKIGTQILFEVTDQNGNVIYSETTDYIDRLGRKIITIYVYPETAVGNALITLLGCATVDLFNSRTIPEEWKNRYNLKWQYQLPVDPRKRNDTEIIFSKQPIISLNEIFKKQNDFKYITCNTPELISGSLTTYSSSIDYNVSYKNISNISQIASNYNEYQSLYTKYSNGVESTSNIRVQEIRNTDQPDTTEIAKNITPSSNNELESRTNVTYKNDSAPTLTLSYPTSELPLTTFRFYKEMEGGLITINNPIDVYPQPQYPYYTSSDEKYEAVITKVINDTTVYLSKPYSRKIIDNKGNIQNIYFTQFNPTQFNLIYNSKYNVIESEAYKNFAEVIITDLEPISGDVFRIKPYVRSVTDATDYVPMTDIILETTNLLKSTSSYALEEYIGEFKSQDFINSYWNTSSNYCNVEPTLSYSNSTLANSMYVTSSGILSNGYWEIYHISESAFQLYKNNSYKLKLDVYGEKNSTEDAECLFVISGSAFNNDNIENTFNGGYIGKVKIQQPNKIFRNLTYEFYPDNDGNGILKFFIKKGLWKISNVSIEGVKDTGFSPNNTKFVIPLKPTWDNDTLDFKFELYDYKGNLCNQVLYLKNVTFDHGYNHYIQGQYNLITGSQFIGRRVGSGIEQTGKHSAIVKSVGYNGYGEANNGGNAGFLLWSGSFVLPDDFSSLYATSYSGVGLELHGGIHSGSKTHALHFDTDSGILQITGSIVATDAVFNNYAIADYLGSRVLIINGTNKNSYLKNYSFRGMNWSYVDLSAEVTDSAMFVRFEEVPDYPITHVQIPQMYSFHDYEIGGNVTFEFINNAAISTSFAHLTSSITYPNPFDGNNYTPINTKLQESNAIKNYSGSFSYLGFNDTIKYDLNDYHNLLSGRPNARYIFTKGYDGFGLTSATNFDNITFTLKQAAIAYQFGTRRNIWIPANQVSFTGNPSDAVQEFYTGSSTIITETPAWRLNTSLPFPYIIGDFIFSFNVPEFVINTTGSIYHQFAVSTALPGTKLIYTTNQKYSVSDFDVESNAPQAISTYILPDDALLNFSIDTFKSTAHNTIIMPHLQSGNFVTYKFSFAYRVALTSIYYIGTRIIFDQTTNFGGFGTMARKNPPIA